MSEFLQLLANIVQITSGIWVVLLGGKTVFEVLGNVRKHLPLKSALSPLWWTQALSVIIIFLLLLLYFRPGGGIPTGVVPTAVSLLAPPATVASGGQTIDKQVVCMNDNCNPGLKIYLNNVNVDAEKRRTAITFTIVNEGVTNYQMSITATLQSALDKHPHSGFRMITGRGASYEYFLSLDFGERIQGTLEFEMVPYKGTDYRLQFRLSDSSYVSAPTITFDPFALIFS